MTQRIDSATTLTIVALVGVAAGVLLVGVLTAPSAGGDGPATGGPLDGGDDAGVTTFESAEAFGAYLESDSGPTFGGSTVTLRDQAVEFDGDVAVTAEASDDASAPPDAGAPAGDDGAALGGDGGDAPRHSGTNVQVAGVDEPDLLKTDGEWIYYAPQHRPRLPLERDDERRTREQPGTHVIDARDVPSPELAGEVPADGQLLRSGDTLVVLGNDAVRAFDVSDPSSPVELWERELSHGLETARLVDGTIYLVLRDRPSPADPCPIRPMGEPAPGVDGDVPEIPCTEAIRPADVEGGDTTYTALSLDPETGEVGDEVTFVGDGANTVVYVSHDSIYVTYESSPGEAEVRLDFLLGPGSEHLDDPALERVRELREYDLSDRALEIELRQTVQERVQRLPEDEREEVQRAFEEDWQAYVEEHKRELVRTGVVRVDVHGEALDVAATGEVPGSVHDQFSLSERNGHLHVATTTDPREATWENDLYTLDRELEVVDSVTGMGEDQRIYSVRFVEDRAYLVTFRQVDPFYVIDVSDPTDLEKLGKLKLPGYSDYMHPLGDDRVLGIGEENRRVKATVFDASDPTDPRVEDDLKLPEYGTEVSADHHAFLLDQRHEVFFLPGREAGHVISYADGLEEVATVRPDGGPQRAAYIGDHLYVFGGEELVVLDQGDWSEAERLDLG